MKKIATGLYALAATLCACTWAADGYSVLKKEVLGGNGSWDYVTVDADAVVGKE